MKKPLIRSVLAVFGVMLLLVCVGVLAFPRPKLPSLVIEDYCNRYNIRLDGTSIETIYLAPESILANPQSFTQQDPAYQLLSAHRTRVFDPFPMAAWLKDIGALAAQTKEAREQAAPYRLYQLILGNRNSFCREIVSQVMSYLPEATDPRVVIFLTALEGSAAAWITAHLGITGINLLAMRLVDWISGTCSLMEPSPWALVSFWVAVAAGACLGLLLNLIYEGWAVRRSYRAWSVMATGEGEVSTPSWGKLWPWILLSFAILIGSVFLNNTLK